jgi:hypothetical protein
MVEFFKFAVQRDACLPDFEPSGAVGYPGSHWRGSALLLEFVIDGLWDQHTAVELGQQVGLVYGGPDS